jgi:hypothetical protein
MHWTKKMLVIGDNSTAMWRHGSIDAWCSVKSGRRSIRVQKQK